MPTTLNTQFEELTLTGLAGTIGPFVLGPEDIKTGEESGSSISVKSSSTIINVATKIRTIGITLYSFSEPELVILKKLETEYYLKLLQGTPSVLNITLGGSKITRGYLKGISVSEGSVKASHTTSSLIPPVIKKFYSSVSFTIVSVEAEL